MEDSLDSARSLARVVKLWGYETTVAHDGPEAIEASSTTTFDVILLDIGLPGMDAFEDAENIHARSGSFTPVLIALTGYGQAADFVRSRSVGFNDNLVKPVNLDRLRA